MYGGGGQWPGQQQPMGGYMQPQQTGFNPQQQQQQRPMGMQPQQTGFMGQQPTGMGMGMGMMPQATGMGGIGMGYPSAGAGLGGMRQSSGFMPQQQQQQQPQQQRFLSAPNSMMMQPQQTGMMQPQPTGVMRPQATGMMQPQPTGMMRPGGLTPQMTGYPGGAMGMQPTGLMPQMTGMPMDPRMQLMSMQFLPAAQPYQGGVPMAGNMNFNNASMQPSNFQNQIQNLSQQQQGSKEPKIPWALSKDERKSYDSIFRAWDQKGTGFLSGDVAQEVFGQSGLDRDKLMQIWHLSDTENRGKLNLAEFHVAMGLIYRALNGNDIPEHLPAELVPPSARDLSESVDFLKDLLKRDANVRQTTALNLPEAGSNKDTAYGKSRSFHENPIQKQDAAAYKHTDESSTGYKSSARHLDRRTVRYGGESAADDLSEMKRQLAQTQRMLDSHDEKDDDDREVEKEMEELRFRIKRVQDDIDYYNRRGGRDAAENRRKAERELLHLMHERLPLIEKRLEAKDKKNREKNLNESRDRDRRNENSYRGGRYGDDEYSSRKGRTSDYDRDSDYSRSQTPTQRDQDRSRREDSTADARSPPPPPPPEDSQETSRPAPAPPAPASKAAVSAPAPPAPGPPKTMTAEERQAWIRSEAQRRIAERMRALGAVAPASGPSTPDASVEQRLAADKAEAEAKASQADAEAAAREEARRARLEEQRIEREKAAVSTIKSELSEQEKSGAPAPVMQAAREEVDEQEEMLRRREEVLAKEKEERLARFKKLEEEEEDARRQEAAFKERQAQFGAKGSSATLPAPVRKGKGGPPPPPPTRSRAPTTPSVAPTPSTPSAPVPPVPAPQDAVPPPAPPAPVEPVTSPPAQTSGGSSTNPFHRMQPNGAATTPGGTNPFFRQQQGLQDGAIKSPPSSFASSLPAPQRAAAGQAPPAPAAPPASAAAPRRAPDEDDDWGESEHGDHDDDPDGPGSTSRATRQNLAAALFSNLVPTPPQSSTPAPPAAPPAPAAPAPPAAPPAPVQTDGSQPPPPPPAAPSAPAPLASSGSLDRSALLGDIRGGLKLRKAQTNDRSSAPVSGKVIGDASAPVQTYVPPPSPPTAEAEAEATVLNGASHDDETREALASNPNRQSVDWANSLATEHMNQGSKASVMPDEPSVQEEGEDSEDEAAVPEDPDAGAHQHAANGSAVGSLGAGASETDDFDLSQTLRMRSLYAYEGQRDEDLVFPENVVVLAHPAKDASNDWWYGSVASSPNKLGTFPRAYVASIESTTIAKALYDFEGSSSDEMNFKADDELHVVDHEDASWFKVLSPDNRILIVPATYVELTSASGSYGAAVPAVLPSSGNDGPSTSGNGSAALPSSEDEALQLAMRASQKDYREQTVARSREDKDLRRALAMSVAEQDAAAIRSADESTGAHPDKSAQDLHGNDDEDEASSGYSTTGWTSSDEDEEEVDDADGNDATDDEQDSEAERQRAAERLRVLEAAGILVVDDPKKSPLLGKGQGDDNDASAEMRGVEDALHLNRRATRKKPKPERPERVGKDRARRTKPDRPERRPPPPPKEKKPEEEMEDAYDRYVKLSKQVEMARTKQASAASIGSEELEHSTSVDAGIRTPTTPLSPLPTGLASPSQPAQGHSFGTSVMSAGSGFLSSIKNRMGSTAPGERKTTPTISGPMSLGAAGTPSGTAGQQGKELLPSVTINSAASDSSAATSQMTTTTWTSLMGADSVRDIPDVERKRQEAIFELIATETTHVRDLQIIVNVFFNAIQPLLSAKAATVIFANIEEILLAAVSLLSDLEDRQRQERLFITHIGDILDTHMSNMSVYIPYCVNQETATQILSAERNRLPELQVILSKIRNEDPAARGLDLSHFLLIPMQRLTRYPLLIQQIVRYTSEGGDEAEVTELQKAAAKAQRFLDTTNESIRQRQSDERLASLSERINNIAGDTQVRLDLTHATRWMGPRRIVADEIVTKAKSGRKIALILCNDILLLMTGGRDADERLYRMPMPLEEVVVREVTSSLKGRDDAAFQIVHQGRERTNVRCSSVRACHTLMHTIDSARGACLATANKRSATSKRHSRVMSS